MEYEGKDFIHQTGFFSKIWILFSKYACYCDSYSCFIYLFILFLVYVFYCLDSNLNPLTCLRHSAVTVFAPSL